MWLDMEVRLSRRKMQSVVDSVRIMRREVDFVERFDSEQFVPTDTLVGSKARVQVYADRVQAGLPLWHANDNPVHESTESHYDNELLSKWQTMTLAVQFRS